MRNKVRRACGRVAQRRTACERPPRSLRSRLPLREGETKSCESEQGLLTQNVAVEQQSDESGLVQGQQLGPGAIGVDLVIDRLTVRLVRHVGYTPAVL